MDEQIILFQLYLNYACKGKPFLVFMKNPLPNKIPLHFKKKILKRKRMCICLPNNHPCPIRLVRFIY